MRNRKYKEGVDANLNLIPASIQYEDYKAKNMEECISSDTDPECKFIQGQNYDLTIVSERIHSA